MYAIRSYYARGGERVGRAASAQAVAELCGVASAVSGSALRRTRGNLISRTFRVRSGAELGRIADVSRSGATLGRVRRVRHVIAVVDRTGGIAGERCASRIQCAAIGLRAGIRIGDRADDAPGNIVGIGVHFEREHLDQERNVRIASHDLFQFIMKFLAIWALRNLITSA